MTSSHAAGRSVADRNFRSSFYVRFTDRTLLAEPFTLALREDVATTTAMALKVAGTHKLRAATGAGGCQGQQAAPDPSGVPVQNAICSGQTMAQLAEQLPRMAYFPGGQQVVDETGLSGTWDFELKWMPRAMLAQAGADAITIQSAIEKLGLKLEPKEMKVPSIVVDSVTAEFTANPPDLARRLPPAPDPQFEVAVVKPSPPEAQGPRAQLLPNGQGPTRVQACLSIQRERSRCPMPSGASSVSGSKKQSGRCRCWSSIR
jgi:hypothetical protein